ncbi:MAG: hypothetical protein GY716_18090 [bacterium]|nr:hypothetical protein [bacterium]
MVKELFSDASGNLQFVELWCPPSQPNEINMNGKSITSLTGPFHTFTGSFAPGSTGDAHILLGTAAFAALPGAPTPDHIIPPNSFSVAGPDTIQWHVYGASILSYGTAQLPTDGVNSLTRPATIGPNSPTNFAGESGSVVITTGPPAVPGLTLQRLDTAGTEIQFDWDVAACEGADSYHLIAGHLSDLPSAPGGAYTARYAYCFASAVGQTVWDNVPPAADGNGLLWFLAVSQDVQQIEGSWGLDGSGSQRSGTGVNGSSGVCASIDRDAGNTCGEGPVPTITGVWQVVSMHEECGEDVPVTLPQQTPSGITYDFWYEITETTFHSYYDLSTFPGGFPQQDGIYHCADWQITAGSVIDVDSIIQDDGTTIRFELAGEQLVVRMEYADDPGCTDTYFTSRVSNTDFSSAISDCDLFDDEF